MLGDFQNGLLDFGKNLNAISSFKTGQNRVV
jgi:hypothetical protein